VLAHLLAPLFGRAYITGWCITSEILPLEWQHLDFSGGELRLDASITKNPKERTFPLTNDLRTLPDE
jgi:integrase